MSADTPLSTPSGDSSDADQVPGKPSRTVTKNVPLPSRSFFAAAYSAEFQNPQAASFDGKRASKKLS